MRFPNSLSEMTVMLRCLYRIGLGVVKKERVVYDWGV